MTPLAAAFLGVLAAALLASFVQRSRSAPPQATSRHVDAARELRGLQEDLRAGDIDAREYERSRERLAARLAASSPGGAPRKPGSSGWQWAVGGLVAAALVAAALIPAVRQRGADDSPTGNDFGSALSRAQQGVRAWEQAERALVAGDRRLAVTRYREAVGALPERPDLRSRFGFALLQTGRRQEALAQLRFAVRRAPRFPETRLYLGTALFEAGRRQDAAAQWRRFLELVPPGSSNRTLRTQVKRLLRTASRRSTAPRR